MNKNLQRFVKADINIEHYDGCPAFIEMAGAGFTKHLYGAPIPSYAICASFFRQKQGDYLTLVSDQKRIGSTVVAGFIDDERTLLDLYDRWLANFAEIMRRFPYSFVEDLSTLNENALIAWSDALAVFYKDRVGMPGFIDGYMFYADKRLDEILRFYCQEHGIPEYPKLFSILSAAVKPSFLNEEEKGVRYLARHPKDKLLAETHLKKWAWIKSSYAGYTPYTSDALTTEIGKVELAAADNDHFVKNAETKRALIAQHGFTEEIRAIARLTEILIKWQDQRKEYTLTFVSLKQKVLNEVARRTGISSDFLAYTETAEIPEVLTHILDENILAERQKGCVFIYENGATVEVLAGQKAVGFFEDLARVDVEGITEVRGLVASLGKATGPARIIMTAQNIHDVKDGDILIAPMTRPEHMLGMKKAIAIVTDDGGITCHAAIVARELKKPCIIGTKVATQVFKDGDLVEVDAEKGIVRKI